MNKKKGVLLVLGTAIISGIAIFINKFSLATIDSSVFTFLKGVIVSVFLLSILLAAREFKTIKTITKKQWVLLVLIGLIGGSIPFLLFFKGLALTSAASAAFMHKTLFIYASLFAVVFLKEKINKKIFLAAILLLVGNLLLLQLSSFTFGVGELLVLSAAILWAGENVLSKHTLKKLSGNIVAFGRMFFGSLFILTFLIMTNKAALIPQIPLQGFLWTIITSIVLLLFVTTYYNGLKHIKVSVATSILLLGSPITMLLSSLFLSATLAITQLIGISLIALGIIATVLYIELPKEKLQNLNCISIMNTDRISDRDTRN
ncbi:MAG: DMT family transporter [Candidatus Woesearchaeota archaeon]